MQCPRFRLALALSMLLPAAALAQQPLPGGGRARVLVAARTDTPPAIDGRLDDAVWAGAPMAAGFVQLRPSPGAAATQPTEVRLAYDDQALYVGARLVDAHPDSVVGRLARRDQEVFSDWFAVLVDSYQDRRTAFSFAVNPRGVKRDVMHFGDTEQDAGWDAVWEAATRVDSLGWTAELRIPLSQLRFSAGPGERAWGVNFARTLARRDELAYWSPVSPDAAGLVSQFGTLAGLRELRPPRRLELQPYTVARLTRAPGEAEDPYHRPTAAFGSVGADLRYGVTSDLTLTATLNPDFGQVEADPSEVNLTTFETYLQEKRPFFTEGADIFATGGTNLFYSRRIGRAPRGSAPDGARFSDVPGATTILGAAKLTGKTAGGWSIGVLDAVTAPEEARSTDAAGRESRVPVEPLTNYAMARVVRDFRRGGSSLGAVATAVNRRLEPGLAPGLYPSQAYAGGVDGRHRFGGGDYQVQGTLLGSRVAGSAEALAEVQRSPVRYFQRPDADHLRFDSTRTSLAGYRAQVGLARIGGSLRWDVGATANSPGFEINDLGFLPGVDRVREYAAVEYQRFRPGPVFRSWQLRFAQSVGWSFGGERTDALVSAFGGFQLANHWGGYAWYDRRLGALSTTELRGGPALQGPASHVGGFGLNSDRRRRVGVEVEGLWQREDGTGGRLLDLWSTVSVRASERMEMSLRPAIAWNVNPSQYVGTFGVAGRREYVVGGLDQTTTSLTARLDYTFTPTLSLQLYAQPFLSAGRFGEFRRVADPRAARFSARFHTFTSGEISSTRTADGRIQHRIDLDADGSGDLTLRDPGFNVKSLDSNAVLRWEYRPGSALFVVWSQGRDHFAPDGRFDLRRNTASLLGAPGTHVLTVKASYWLGL